MISESMETLIYFLRAATAFDIFGTNNAGDLLTGFPIPTFVNFNSPFCDKNFWT